MWVGLGAGLLLGPAAREAAAQSVNVCDRTVQVRDAIVAASGGDNCAQLTVRDMREITALDLRDQDIATLRADDFDGLVRLKSLDLSDNLLTSLPRGVFDELYLLEILRLDGNLLEGLPVGIFDQLFLLEDLSLDDNRFTSLPEGLFDELSRFDGFQASGDPPDNSGPHARLRRFLDRHSITSVEEFISALPALHQERFVMVYRSEALAPEAITEEHPRIIAWGVDGRFVFSWPTNPETPHPFGVSVEFLQQADDRTWIAGEIDFSNPTPEIAQPAVCQSCHGSLSKPLWGGYFRWGGTEGSYEPDELLANAENNYRAAYSNNPRITPLDFSASVFYYGYKRYFEESSPAHPYTGPVEEASLVLALRHAEVLFERLKAREDYAEFAENTVCSSDAGGDAQRSFMDAHDHTIGVFANELRSVGSAVGSWLSGATYPNYNYQDAHFGEILVFLIVHDLWETHAAVRRLYRSVSNADLRDGERGGARRAEDHLVYPVGEATAEDELIQLYRLHFGYGGRASLAAIAAAQPYYGEGAFTARFGEGHLWTMLPRVCATLRGAGWEITPGPFSVPEGETAVATLSVSEEAATAELSWSLPSGTSPDGAHFEMTAEGALVFGAPKDFEAPDDSNGDGTYEVSVQVSDGARSASADISVTLSNRNEAPVTDAGADQEDVEGGATVALSGTGTDPDADDTLTYGWTQTGGTTVTLSAAASAATSFTAPANLSQDETLRFTLRVTDAAGLYAEDEVAVTVRGSRNEAPVTDAGADQEDVEGGATVALSGTGTDPDADDTLTYGWTQTGGTTVTLSAASAAATSFTAPANLSQDETLRFTLRVTDAAGLYAEDAVAITVRGSRNEAPVADAGADQDDVEGGATVALSGTGTDPDADDTLTYGWTQTGGTTVTLSSASAAATSFTAPANLSQDETLRFTLRVTDAAGLYAEDEVAVTVRRSRNEAPVADAGADQEDVEGGATVALSGTGTDPDADDTLTYGWTQTGGTTVTLSAAASAATSFTAPANLSQDETLRFTLRVTDAAGLYAEDEVAVTVRGSTPLTAWIEGVPARHDGSSIFIFELHFSEEVSLSYVTVRDSAFEVTGGRVTNAGRQSPPSNLSWYIHVQPDAGADVELVLPAGRACDASGAICTANGTRLSSGLTITVQGPPATPLTARVEGVPAGHDGSSVFIFELHFSEEVSLSYVTVRDSAFQVTGGRVTNAGRQSPPSNLSWYIHVQPESDADVELVLPAGRACDASGAICTANGKWLSNGLTIAVSGPE